MKKIKIGQCELCDRHCDLTFHHLVPRKMHRRKSFKKRYSSIELNAGINICRLCHTGIHKLFDELTLARLYSSREKLLANELIAKHIQWVGKQKVSARATRV